MDGENFVSLKGYIQKPDLKAVGDNNSQLFKGRLSIPINGKAQYIKIAAWGAIAEGLGKLSKRDFVHIHGHIEEHAYDGNCRNCNCQQRKYWTEVLIDNFVIIE